MSTDAIKSYISECSHVGRLEFQVSIQCAQVLKGVKASNLITVAKGSLKTVRNALAGTEINTIMLAAGDRTEVLFLYRYPMLKALMSDEKVRRFLKSCGYTQFDIASVFMGLKRKYMAYLAGNGDFPHELGILLEYPVEDVKDFVRFDGKDFLFAGYWKVYHNPAQAREKFKQYDRARETAMQQIINGCRLREAAVRKGE